MVRIRDVAGHAGVSTATVSRVLNGKQVRADLAEAVHAAVAELGYVPDRTARSLRTGTTPVIALVVPDIANPFFTSLARVVEDVAAAAGYSVVLCNTDDVAAKERGYLEIALRQRMAGVILAPADASPDLGALLAAGRAVVVIDRDVPEAVDRIAFDNEGLGRRATEALLRRGFTDIACITGPESTSTARARAAGWRAALAGAGIEPGPGRLTYANFRVDGGRAAAAGLLASPRRPQAVLATNNLVGVGTLQALAGAGEHGIAVGIIGDLPFATSDMSEVTLTPLRPEDLGRRAIERLLARLRGEAGEPVRIVLPLQ
ncbi:substrate-binding domain-containing protein [Pseudactinotalea sp. HY160]|uniref:LacI family DNA-binding transcriptional regulator n=1 Tax=Pseudactinotalea sp. HY160 TaxID=2654490 RepID=UPI00128DE3A5|nr:LacI family DNA-binding transcriptional regulator [Pseudactinotalea sp. HY160]MPV50862.1 substrate-binding domain-containing protein [Pseudactinotalea sp. HY160]